MSIGDQDYLVRSLSIVLLGNVPLEHIFFAITYYESITYLRSRTLGFIPQLTKKNLQAKVLLLSSYHKTRSIS